MDFDCSGTGRRFRAKDWHVPLPCYEGVQREFPSSKASEHPRVTDRRRAPPGGRFARLPRPAKTADSCDTPRRMAPFRRPGCLDTLLGDECRGDCSPEDRSSLGLRPTASDRPPGDAALLRGTLPTERSMLAFEGSLVPPLPGRGERRLEPW